MSNLNFVDNLPVLYFLSILY